VNLYGCKIGKNTKVDSYVYIEEGVTIGDDCKIRPFVFIPTGVTIEDDVFIAPNVTSRMINIEIAWRMETSRDSGEESRVHRGSTTITPGVTIGENALIGAGSVVTKDIPDNAIAMVPLLG